MNKIIYPFKDNSSPKDLIYSLRSIEKFYPDSKVVLLSNKIPKGIKGVELYKSKDISPQASRSVWSKILNYATRNKGEQFLYMNDDIVLLKEFDWLKNQMSSGDLHERLKGMKEKNAYSVRIMKTISLIEGLNFKPLCFDIHQPMTLESDFILWLENHFKVSENGYLFKSLYGILSYQKYNQFEFQHSKISKKEEYNENMVCLSTSNIFQDYDFLETIYTKKSRFEQ